MSTARCVWPANALLGEGPVFDRRDNSIYFVDIKGPALHRVSLDDGARTSWDAPEAICWVIPRANKPGFIAGFKSGFYELTLDPFHRTKICAPEEDRPTNRRNDAKADAQGRIWAGSMDDEEQHVTGALYRLDPDFSWKRMDDGYKVCNGPAFNLAGDAIYHTDTGLGLIYRFDLSPDGEISNKRPFIRFEHGWGYPDGMTTDAEDHLWVAHWDGARLSRFRPDGKLDRTIALPVSRVTSCVFAGEDLERMFVTTARVGREDEKLAGALFEVDPGVRGAPAYAFAG